MKTDWEKIPGVLRKLPQWVLWRYEERDGRKTKVPYQRDGARASVSDSQSWHSFDIAQSSANGHNGVGFVLTSVDPICAIDLDDCISEHGTLDPAAAEIIRSLDSYTEISPSGRGIRILIIAKKPGPKCRTKFKNGAIEIYDRDRFVTITGMRIGEREINNRQPELEALYESAFPTADTRNESPLRKALPADRSEYSRFLGPHPIVRIKLV